MLYSTYIFFLKSAPSLTVGIYICGGGFFLGGGHVFLAFYAIYISKKKILGIIFYFFLEKQFFSFNVFYFQHFFGNIEKCPITYWLSGFSK